MKGLYIGSTAGYSGKNMITMGLGIKLQQEGYTIGYMKPVGALPFEKNGILGDEDAFFVQDIIGLEQDPSLLTPVVVTHDFKVKALTSKHDGLLEKISANYNTLAENKDIMLLGGSGSLFSGKYANIDALTIIEELDLQVLIIDRFQKEVQYDMLLMLKEKLKNRLAGVILNDIPSAYEEEVKTLMIPFLEKNGIKVLGTIPHDPLMGAIKVGALAERLGGKIISAHAQSERVVENFLIGTMQVENFMTHFRRKIKSAVIVGGDRSDVQLVALEGACPCLILTGNLYPNEIKIGRAHV